MFLLLFYFDLPVSYDYMVLIAPRLEKAKQSKTIVLPCPSQLPPQIHSLFTIRHCWNVVFSIVCDILDVFQITRWSSCVSLFFFYLFKIKGGGRDWIQYPHKKFSSRELRIAQHKFSFPGNQVPNALHVAEPTKVAYFPSRISTIDFCRVNHNSLLTSHYAEHCSNREHRQGQRSEGDLRMHSSTEEWMENEDVEPASWVCLLWEFPCEMG